MKYHRAMARRLPAVLAVSAVACATLAGCQDTPDPAPSATPSRYIDAVESLLDPPARLASTISQRSTADAGPLPAPGRLQDLVDRARESLAEFRALRLEDPTLRRQRDGLAGAYAAMIPRMQEAVDAVSSDGRVGLARGARPFLDALGGLPSAASSP